LADPNLTPEAKQGAIANVIANGNSTLQWGSAFYKTEIPAVTEPGSTGIVNGVINPPAAAPAPAPAPTPAPAPASAGAQAQASKVGLKLPAGWDSYTPARKIEYLNAEGITVGELQAAGLPPQDIEWMLQNGFTGGQNGLTGGTGLINGATND